MVRLGAVGDVVRTLPAVSRLRAAWPGAHISWLVEAPSASAIEGQPWVDEVLVFPRDRLQAALVRGELRRLSAGLALFLRRLRARRFDLVVDFHSLFRSSVLALLSGARRRVGYAPPIAREFSHLLATDRAELVPGKLSRFERNAGLVEYLGVDVSAAEHPLRVSPDECARMAAGLEPGSAPVALHPGSSDATPHKRWGVPAYAALARTLIERRGIPSVVTVGPGRDDERLAREVVDAAGGAARLAPATPTLRDLAALLASCRLYVGGDTGPLHVATLVGTPVVQLLGPTDPVENAPGPETPSRTLRVSLGCSPCRRGCAAAPCMSLIEPEAVVEAVLELLAGEVRRNGARDPLSALQHLGTAPSGRERTLSLSRLPTSAAGQP